jgi:DNA-binding NarL/FixJ family response regulator
MGVSVVIADDHPLVRLGIRNVLQAEPDLEIVGEAAEALEVLPLVEHWRPNVLVLDLVMPGQHGLEVIRQVSKRVPETRIVVLSMYANEAYVIEALHNGASAYVLKGSDAAEVLRALRAVLDGGCYLSPPLSERAIEMYAAKTAGPTLDAYDTLSTRERQVLHLVAEGHTNAEIGTRLFVSVRTVETHRANLMRKLKLHSQSELIRYALRRGILTLES